MATMAENIYTFPVYKADEIVIYFRSEVLTVQEAKHFTQNDLTPNPKPESIRLLYKSVLHLVHPFRPEFINMVQFSEILQHVEYHEWTTGFLHLYLFMQKFLPTCFVYGFSLNDMLAPKAKRTLYVLSGIMNFLKFRRQKMERSLEVQARFRLDTDRLQALTKGIKEAEKKIEVLTNVLPERQAEDKELTAEISEVHTASMHSYQRVNGLKETIAERKTEKAKKSQKLTLIKVDVCTLKEDNRKLWSQILESPEELENQMEKMRENMKKIKSSVERADERVVELQSRVQGETHNEAEIQLMYKLLEELQSSMTNFNQRQEEVQELVGLYEKQQKELNNLYIEEGQLRRTMDMKLNKKYKWQIWREKKREKEDKHVQDVLGQCDHVHQKCEEMADQIQDISRDTQQLKAKMQDLRDVCSKETATAQALFDGLHASLVQFRGLKSRSER